METLSSRLWKCSFPTILAVVCIVVAFPSDRGMIDWQALGTSLGEPWSYVINDSTGPKMATLLRILGAGWFVFAIVCGLLIPSAKARGVAGETLVLLASRGCEFVWMIFVLALFLLYQVDWSIAMATFTLSDGDVIVLTAPTLVVMTVFSLFMLLLRPRPARRYLWKPLQVLSTIIPAYAGVMLCVALERQMTASAHFWDQSFGPAIVAQSGIGAVTVWMVLFLEEGFLSVWSDFRTRKRNGLGSDMRLGFRGLAWAFLLLLPTMGMLYGVWIGLFYKPDSASVIVDRYGEEIALFYVNGGVNRRPVHYDEISGWVFMALESTEDRGILESPKTHLALSPVRVASIVMSGGAGGGSGLASQTCKNVIGQPLTRWAVSLFNKVPAIPSEVVLVARLSEKVLWEFQCGWTLEQTSLWHTSPDRDLLPLYLNEVEFGRGAVGIEAAAQLYFGVSAAELNIEQSALLVGLLQGPTRLDPWNHPEDALERRAEVLAAMAVQGHITEDDAAWLATTYLGILDEPAYPVSGHDRLVQAVMVELDGAGESGFSKNGSTIHTSIDLGLQYQLGYIAQDVIAYQSYGNVNTAGVVVINPTTGEVLAWYGGPGNHLGDDAVVDMVSEYPHQSGSTIKPLVYVCALELGVLEPDELLNDTQRSFDGEYVANWDYESRGFIPADQALYTSRNVPSVELVDRMSPERFMDCLHDSFDIDTDLPPDLSAAALGRGLFEVPITEMIEAFSVLANGGRQVELSLVTRVESRDGETTYKRREVVRRQTLSCESVSWVGNALTNVSGALGIPGTVSSKTGTTPSTSAIAAYGEDFAMFGWIGRAEADRGLLSIEPVPPGAGGILQGLMWGPLADAGVSATGTSCPSSQQISDEFDGLPAALVELAQLSASRRPMLDPSTGSTSLASLGPHPVQPAGGDGQDDHGDRSRYDHVRPGEENAGRDHGRDEHRQVG